MRRQFLPSISIAGLQVHYTYYLSFRFSESGLRRKAYYILLSPYEFESGATQIKFFPWCFVTLISDHMKGEDEIAKQKT